MHAELRREADALFENGDPKGDDLTPEALDVTRRFLMESMRLYPIVPMSVRNVMNSCVVEGYELTVGTRIHIAQTATHYMNDIFPDAESLTSTATCRREMNITARPTRRLVWARTAASARAGWSCNWRSTC